MVQQQCKEHLFGNMILKIEGEEDKYFTACLHCGFQQEQLPFQKEFKEYLDTYYPEIFDIQKDTSQLKEND